jgi:hypothetical protein
MSVSVALVIQNAKLKYRITRIVLLWIVWLDHVLPHYFIKDKAFRKKKLLKKCVLFFLPLCPKYFSF